MALLLQRQPLTYKQVCEWPKAFRNSEPVSFISDVQPLPGLPLLSPSCPFHCSGLNHSPFPSPAVFVIHPTPLFMAAGPSFFFLLFLLLIPVQPQPELFRHFAPQQESSHESSVFRAIMVMIVCILSFSRMTESKEREDDE